MYEAKSSGRGGFKMFVTEMETKIQEKRLLETELRRAVAEGGLEVFYQPIVCARSEQVMGYEALLRWRHPERGSVPPSVFIPLAEETGLIQVIGAWVLHQACQEASRWPSGLRVAVNLSPLQFRGSDILTVVATALRSAKLPAARLELEITESVLLDDDEATLNILHQLRDLGTRISMDDFGTGYSSLSYLCRFPFDTIKIDRSFVNSMRDGNDGLAIVQSTISLARTLRMNVIAEGVETRGQLMLLRDAECHEIQGYLFAPPRPASEIRFDAPKLAAVA
jgi:EAL domain-containing protein (putative c-di-GMP-specific phosphodiesterase class I)